MRAKERLNRTSRAGLIALSLLLIGCGGCPLGLVPVDTTGADGSSATAPTDNVGDSLQDAKPLNLTGGATETLAGEITSPRDTDVYALGTLGPGDRVEIDVEATGGTLDPVAAVFDSNELLIAFSDDRDPTGADLNPRIDFVIAGDVDTYYLAIIAYPETRTTGTYGVRVTVTPGSDPDFARGQILYLDWRGGDGITVPNVGTYDLPAFSATDLGLSASQTEAFKVRVQQIVEARYAGYDMIVLSSDDYATPAQAHSTVYFGGFNARAFAISEQIDSYNQDPSDETIVFTRSYRGAFAGTPGFEELAQAVGNTVAHEVGHLLGLVHTKDAASLMDASAPNDSILVPQAFTTAELLSAVFPFGYQPAEDLLAWILGVVGM
jgi:hypothetical protein